MKRFSALEKETLAIAAVVVAVILFISVNILSSTALTFAQLDLTEDGLYTLSDGTRNVLADIDEPITLRFYLSKQLAELSPVYANYSSRVQEILARYANLAGNMVRLEVYHPEPYSAEEDKAMAYGLQGIPISNAGDMAYFGLVATNSTDDQKIIPIFNTNREQFLEYDLTKLIYSLSHPKKTVIGLLSSLPLGADPKRQYKPWPVYERLKNFFELRSLRAIGSEIDDSIDVVMVVHPQKINEAQRYALDQFVMRGGKVLVFVDPHFESAERSAQAGPPKEGETSSNLKRLFDAWGIEFTTDQVIADRTLAQRVNMASGGRMTVTDYPVWLALGAANFDRTDVVTAQISRINLASAGYLRAKPGAGVTLTALLKSSTQAKRVDVEDVNFIPDIEGMLADYQPEGQEFALAARFRGKARSAYPDGSPFEGLEPLEGEGGEGQEAAPAKREHLSESVKSINVVVVADVDMLVDRFWVQMQNYYGRQVAVPVANNADFIVNVIDNMSGSDALISLRSRGLSYRPFYRIEAIRRDAELRFRETEESLVGKLREAENKLKNLRGEDVAGGGEMLTAEQKETITNIRGEMLATRQQLRDVQHALRKDIEAMDGWLKAINIWAMALVVSILALVLALVRRARYRRHTIHT